METTKRVVEKKYFLFGKIPLWKTQHSEYEIIPDEIAEQYNVNSKGEAVVQDQMFNQILENLIPYMNPNMGSTEDVLNAQKKITRVSTENKKWGCITNGNRNRKNGKK